MSAARIVRAVGFALIAGAAGAMFSFIAAGPGCFMIVAGVAAAGSALVVSTGGRP